MIPGARSITKSNAINPNTLTNNSVEADKYRDDPLIHDQISYGIAGDMLTRGNSIVARVTADESNALVINSGVPVLLVHGTEDIVCKLEGSKRLGKAVKAKDMVEMVVVDKAKHEMHHELPAAREIFFEAVCKFTNKCLA
jgi:alpha-beta hydrolase superfamily lysophospholipase